METVKDLQEHLEACAKLAGKLGFSGAAKACYTACAATVDMESNARLCVALDLHCNSERNRLLAQLNQDWQQQGEIYGTQTSGDSPAEA